MKKEKKNSMYKIEANKNELQKTKQKMPRTLVKE
jgi:hypothetical protein